MREGLARHTVGGEEEEMTRTIEAPPPIQLAVDYLVERAGAARPGTD
jgi:hypothetical protein